MQSPDVSGCHIRDVSLAHKDSSAAAFCMDRQKFDHLVTNFDVKSGVHKAVLNMKSHKRPLPFYKKKIKNKKRSNFISPALATEMLFKKPKTSAR